MLRNEEILAVTKAMKAKDLDYARDHVVPGRYPVDVTVRLTGEVTVGMDTTKASTSALLSQEFLLLVLHKAGFMREQAMALLTATATEYLHGWTGSDADRAAAKAARQEVLRAVDPEGRMAAFLQATKVALPPTPVRGAVRFAGQVVVVEQAAEYEMQEVG